MKAISIDEEVKKLMAQRQEFLKLGDTEMAENILKLAAHVEQLRTQPKSILLPAGVTLI